MYLVNERILVLYPVVDNIHEESPPGPLNSLLSIGRFKNRVSPILKSIIEGVLITVLDVDTLFINLSLFNEAQLSRWKASEGLTQEFKDRRPMQINVMIARQ